MKAANSVLSLRKLIVSVGAALMLWAGSASAYSLDNRTVDFVGVLNWATNGLHAYVAFVGGIPTGSPPLPPNACLYGVIYFDHTTIHGKAWYTTLLTAKAAALKVSVSFTQDGTNTCVMVDVRIKS